MKVTVETESLREGSRYRSRSVHLGVAADSLSLLVPSGANGGAQLNLQSALGVREMSLCVARKATQVAGSDAGGIIWTLPLSRSG